jgi:hypothetical protein
MSKNDYMRNIVLCQLTNLVTTLALLVWLTITIASYMNLGLILILAILLILQLLSQKIKFFKNRISFLNTFKFQSMEWISMKYHTCNGFLTFSKILTKTHRWNQCMLNHAGMLRLVSEILTRKK